MRFWALLVVLTCFLIGASPAFAHLRIGTVYFYPPFVMSSSTGFDIQLIGKICEKLHETCELVPMNYNALFSDLKTGSIDLALGGITTYSAGHTHFIYSLPYLLSKGGFLSLQNSSIQSIDDLQGNKVGIVKGSQDGDVFYDYLDKEYHDKFEIVQYDDIESLIAALSNGEITAAFTHESTVLYWRLNGNGLFRTLGSPKMVGQGIAIMAPDKSTELINNINKIILELEQEAFYMGLYTTYFANEK